MVPTIGALQWVGSEYVIFLLSCLYAPFIRYQATGSSNGRWVRSLTMVIQRDVIYNLKQLDWTPSWLVVNRIWLRPRPLLTLTFFYQYPCFCGYIWLHGSCSFTRDFSPMLPAEVLVHSTKLTLTPGSKCHFSICMIKPPFVQIRDENFNDDMSRYSVARLLRLTVDYCSVDNSSVREVLFNKIDFGVV